MDRIDIVKTALDLENPNRFSDLSDDFQSTDSVGSPPLYKSAWIGMGQIMGVSFPDIEYVKNV